MKEKFLTLLVPVLCTLLFCGCPLAITVVSLTDDSIEMDFKAEFGTEFLESIHEMSVMQDDESGQDAGSEEEINLSDVIHTEKIEAELAKNFAAVSKVFIRENNQFIVNMQIPQKSLASQTLLRQDESPEGKKRLILTLSPESLRQAIMRDDSYIRNFADILMAPIFTGEQMSAEEYREFLISIYGESLASELVDGNLFINFKLNKNGNIKKRFSIPLKDLLTLTEARIYIFEW